MIREFDKLTSTVRSGISSKPKSQIRALSALRGDFVDLRQTFSFASSATVPAWQNKRYYVRPVLPGTICAVVIHWLFAECSCIEKYWRFRAWRTCTYYCTTRYDLCCAYSLIICRTFIHWRYQRSPFTARPCSWEMHEYIYSTSNNQCTCFRGLPATYTLPVVHIICTPMSLENWWDSW